MLLQRNFRDRPLAKRMRVPTENAIPMGMVAEALARGHRVVGTLRDEGQRRAFDALAPGRSAGRLLDVTDTPAVAALVGSAEAEFDGIDVLVNNAGYGLRGAMEELDLDALRRQFAVNVVGPVALIQAVLPGMRRRRAGHILNMASMGSVVAFPGLGASTPASSLCLD